MPSVQVPPSDANSAPVHARTARAMRKKVDARIRTLIENGVLLRHRGMFVVVGDAGREQVVNLHYMLSKAAVKTRPSVLWCYKKELGFTSHRRKRMNQIKKKIQRGLLDPDKDDPFELFISATDINYCYYKDTARVLGNTGPIWSPKDDREK